MPAVPSITTNGHAALNGNAQSLRSPGTIDGLTGGSFTPIIDSPLTPLHDNAQGSLPVWQPSAQRPKNVGIHGIELHIPKRCISQTDLEKFDGVSAGKYTIGLGQEYMAYVDDREDINSFALSATASILQKYKIDPRSVGRIDVGTETIIDKAKSVKSVLMDLFAPSGNHDIEGIDSKNACYGGTAALFNAINWVESSSWDGRYALVVAGDIAIYSEGSARPVGGAGAMALLIGPDAPIVVEPAHGTFMANSWDFFKPELSSEYPSVDGPLTVVAYLGALEATYTKFLEKDQRHRHKGASSGSSSEPARGSLNDFDYFAFHNPYNKIVQKGFARLLYQDFIRNPNSPEFSSVNRSLVSRAPSQTLVDKEVEKIFTGLSKGQYTKKVWPGTTTSRRLGNMYAASFYGSLASIIGGVEPEQLKGKRIGAFSYGSGLAATFFALRVEGDTSKMREALGLEKRLQSMEVTPVEEFLKALATREHTHNIKDWKPEGKVENVFPGSYYLEECDKTYRRTYGYAA